MKNLTLTVGAGVAIGWAAFSTVSVPVVQKSHSTGNIVACASEDTNWEMVSVVDHPECKTIKSAEVEWVK